MPVVDTQTLENAFASGVYGKRPLTIVRGAGASLWDDAGRRYVDLTAGIGVANVGHAHPAVTDAITAQASRLITCPEMFYNDIRAHFLAALGATLPPALQRLYLCNSGAEAVETALKFARLSTGRTCILAAQHAFHGRTMGALSLTHKAAFRRPFAPLVPDIEHIPYNDTAALDEAVNDATAALILEVVQGEGGVHVAAPGYLQAARAACDRHGALLILDEVQTGFGRTGRMFAFEHTAVVPDLVCLAKGIAGGFPMGAVAIGQRVTGLRSGVHGSTFGGNPLACAAAMATLQVLHNAGLPARAARLGQTLRAGLAQLESPLIRDVRGLGLMIGLELRVRVLPLVRELTERGFLTLTAGPTIIRLLPPLVITADDLQRFVSCLADVLEDAHPIAPGRRQGSVA